MTLIATAYTLLVTLGVAAVANGNFYNNANKWYMTRRSNCAGLFSKCFSTHACCKGFVCVGDDSDPLVSGYCHEEKNLTPCKSSRNCDWGRSCRALGRLGDRYCVPDNPDAYGNAAEMARLLKTYVNTNGVNHKTVDTGKVGKGQPCTTSKQCDTSAGLCCIEVRRFRAKAKKMCDKKSNFNDCL